MKPPTRDLIHGIPDETWAALEDLLERWRRQANSEIDSAMMDAVLWRTEALRLRAALQTIEAATFIDLAEVKAIAYIALGLDSADV